VFDGQGKLGIDGSHLDISFRNTELWPSPFPSRSVRSLMFNFGDAEVGPMVQLGAIIPVEGETLDWKHSIDPMHFHGSDQFRVILEGDWEVAGKQMSQGHFAFQEAGRVYQEHPMPNDPVWIFLVIGDRRGSLATLTLERDRETFQLVTDGITEEQAYPHPAGPKGATAIATTIGKCERGYVWGSYDESFGADRGRHTVAGIWGEQAAGPVVYLTNNGPGEVVVPACTFSTEVLLLVTGGSCRIGDSEYVRGDMRVQRAEEPQEDVISGPDGLRAALVVADRRASASPASSAEGLEWKQSIEDLLSELVPTLETV